MTRVRPRLALAVALLMAAGPAAAAERWAASSAGFRVAISDDDIVVTRAAREVFSLRRAARADYDRTVSDADGATVRIDRKVTVVAVAGPYLSLRDESVVELTPSAHPGGETRLWTIDLRRAGRAAEQTDGLTAIGAGRAVDLAVLTGAAPLVRTLALDPFVRRAGAAQAKTLAAMRDALAAGRPAGVDGCYEVPADWTTRFAITGVDGARLLARIGLPGSGPCRNRLTQLGLTIRIAPALRRSLAPAVVPPAAAATVSVTLGEAAARR